MAVISRGYYMSSRVLTRYIASALTPSAVQPGLALCNQRYSTMRLPASTLGPSCRRHAGAAPARRTVTLFANAGSVSDQMQPVSTGLGTSSKPGRKMKSLTRKESQSAPTGPGALASDTAKATLTDENQSKEAAQKKAAVSATLNRIKKEMGANIIMKMDSKQYAEDIVVEIFGPESCGKTSLAVCVMAEAQKQYPDDTVVLMDLECSFDTHYGKRLGLNIDKNSLISSPSSGDQALKMSEALISSGGVSVVVIDSVSALTPESELDREYGDPQVGSQARLLSQALRRLSKVAKQYNVTLIFINQLRMKVGVVYGNPETTSGGLALKFYASQRIDVRKKEMLTTADSAKEAPANGIRVRAKVVKNKTAPPGGEAMFDLMYDRGVDKLSSTIDGAVLAGVLEKRGAYFYYRQDDGTDLPLGQGKINAAKTLEADEKLRWKIHNEALKKLRDANRGVAVETDDESDEDAEVL